MFKIPRWACGTANDRALRPAVKEGDAEHRRADFNLGILIESINGTTMNLLWQAGHVGRGRFPVVANRAVHGFRDDGA